VCDFFAYEYCYFPIITFAKFGGADGKTKHQKFLWGLSTVLNRIFEVYDLNRRKIELKFWPLGEY